MIYYFFLLGKYLFLCLNLLSVDSYIPKSWKIKILFSNL